MRRGRVQKGLYIRKNHNWYLINNEDTHEDDDIMRFSIMTRFRNITDYDHYLGSARAGRPADRPPATGGGAGRGDRLAGGRAGPIDA